ncbi:MULTISPECIES: hypothetical protein [Streptomyces]|nr:MULTISPECIES: hypothetical protein [Streptomyces]MBP2346493.1 hypothetical protein [Streptomyces virginiae]MCI4083718.1 DUF863 family protein [Streptomyces sp. MMS21 TC-5]
MTFDIHQPPPTPDPCQVSGISQELLDRALIGWDRFLSSIEERSDD